MPFSLIVRNIWARRTRSLLTILGIGISIAVVIATFALATNLREELSLAMPTTQADLVAMQKGLAGPTGGSIPESCIHDIAGYEGVQRATGFLLTTVSLSQTPSFNLFGVIPEDSDLYLSQQQLIKGGFVQNGGEIALGKLAQNSLNLQIGKTLQLETGEEFRVVGIYKTGNVYLDSGAIITLKEAQEVAGREGKVTVIAIYLADRADRDSINSMIEQIEADWHYLEVTTAPHLLDTSPTAKFGNAIAWIISAIAVIMGAIGVVNTMFMSVSERTREIGILKAVGWSQFRVLRMILSESLLLSLVGFGVGCLLGMGVIWVITSLPSVQGYVSPSFSGDAFLVGLAVALLLGFLGGVISAYRASRLSPTEALRYE